MVFTFCSRLFVCLKQVYRNEYFVKLDKLTNKSRNIVNLSGFRGKILVNLSFITPFFSIAMLITVQLLTQRIYDRVTNEMLGNMLAIMQVIVVLCIRRLIDKNCKKHEQLLELGDWFVRNSISVLLILKVAPVLLILSLSVMYLDDNSKYLILVCSIISIWMVLVKSRKLCRILVFVNVIVGSWYALSRGINYLNKQGLDGAVRDLITRNVSLILIPIVTMILAGLVLVVLAKWKYLPNTKEFLKSGVILNSIGGLTYLIITIVFKETDFLKNTEVLLLVSVAFLFNIFIRTKMVRGLSVEAFGVGLLYMKTLAIDQKHLLIWVYLLQSLALSLPTAIGVIFASQILQGSYMVVLFIIMLWILETLLDLLMVLFSTKILPAEHISDLSPNSKAGISSVLIAIVIFTLSGVSAGISPLLKVDDFSYLFSSLVVVFVSALILLIIWLELENWSSSLFESRKLQNFE